MDTRSSRVCLRMATGNDWWTLAERHVFTPLGVTDVWIDPDPNSVPCPPYLDSPRVQAVEVFCAIRRLRESFDGTFDALERYAITRAANAWGKTIRVGDDEYRSGMTGGAIMPRSSGFPMTG